MEAAEVADSITHSLVRMKKEVGSRYVSPVDAQRES